MEHWQICLSGPIPRDVLGKRVFRGSNVTEMSAQVMFWVLFARDNVNKPQWELNPAGAAGKIRLNTKDWLCFTDLICAWFAQSDAVKPKVQFVLKSKAFFFHTHQYTNVVDRQRAIIYENVTAGTNFNESLLEAVSYLVFCSDLSLKSYYLFFFFPLLP